jgi:hypothetical protein
MGLKNSKHPDDDKYEEPAPNYQYLQEKWKTVDRPRRIMKNPPVPPCIRGQCNDPVQFLEFKEWMAKEWAVYCAQIKYMQNELAVCFQKHGIDSKRHCRELAEEYMRVVDDEALKEARRKLWRGERLVE